MINNYLYNLAIFSINFLTGELAKYAPLKLTKVRKVTSCFFAKLSRNKALLVFIHQYGLL